MADWEKEVEERLIRYMEIESFTGNEVPLAELLVRDLESNGFTVVRQLVANDSDRFNVLATFQSKSEDVELLLNTHFDTVPPYIAPRQDDVKIYGRGSNEAKGQMACMVTAAIELSRKNPEVAKKVGLLFVVGEEFDHIGMQKANELAIRPKYLIVGEPTELKFATIQKGAFKVRLTARGVAGHSGYPDSGKSAIHLLVSVLHDVMHYKWPSSQQQGDTTYNVGKISGGQALNAWAETAQAELFFRVTTSVGDVQKRLEQIVGGRVEVEPLNFNDPVILDVPRGVAETTQAAFNTDLPFFNLPVQGRFLVGAGSIRNAFSKAEFVPKAELHQFVRLLIDIAKDTEVLNK